MAYRIRLIARENVSAAMQGSIKRGGAKQFRLIGAFLLPGAIIYTIFLVWPILQAGYFSVYDWNGLGPPTKFIALGNFSRIMNDSVFQLSVTHTLIFVTLAISLQLPLALFLATLIGRKLPGRAIFRTIFFVPYVFSEVVTAIIWQFVYTVDGGLANTVLMTLFPGFQAQTWLGNRDIVLFAIFFVITWKYFGLHMILYMAALQNVPAEIEEAARIDGGSEWQVLRYVTFPYIGRTIRLTVYLAIVGSLNQFVLTWIMTKGGPANASHIIATYMYRYGPLDFKLGYGAAVSVVLFGAGFIFSLLYQRFIMRGDYEGDAP